MSEQDIVTIMPAPAGYVVNYAHPPQHGATTAYTIAAIGTTLAFATLMMRLYTRFFITCNAAAEDWCMIVAFVIGIATQATILRTFAITASGVHSWDMPLERYNQHTLLTVVMAVIYGPSLAAAKLSILFLYRRLSPVRLFHYCIYAIIAIIACYTTALTLLAIFPCKPIESNWNVTVPGKCIDKAKIYLSTAGANIATDVLILVLPIPMVWSLQMPRIQKIGLLAMFAFGSATCITSIIRLIYMIPMVTNPDTTHAVAVPLIWVEVEVNLIIIVGCLPALRHFLRYFSPRLVGESSRHADYADTSNPNFTPYNNKTISHITSRALGRKSKGRHLDNYDMMTKSDEDMELTKVDKDDKDNISQDGPDPDVEKQIWTTKTFAVQ